MTRREVAAGGLLAGMALALTACSKGDAPATGAPTPVGNFVTDPAAVIGASTIALSLDGSRIAAGQRGGVTVWDTATGAQSARWTHGAQPCWDPAGKVVALVDDRALAINLVDPGTGTILRSLTGYGRAEGVTDFVGTVASVVFSPDGSRLVASAYDGTLHSWSTAGGELQWSQHVAQVATSFDLAVSADGSRLACIGDQTPLHIRGTDTGELVPIPGANPTTTVSGGTPTPGRGLAFSPDGRFLASGHGEFAGRLVVRDPDSFVVRRDIPVPQGRPYRLAFSPDSHRVALTMSGEKPVFVIPVDGGRALSLRGHTEPAEAVAWSLDGVRLYSASRHDGIRVWDVATGKGIRTIR